ncbi:MAG TPA: HAD family hydrolase [Kofleriaceae bacterium]|nr:HAD family hydrolase [Kofleriaceae bacterium]
MTPLYLFDIDGTLVQAHGSGRVAFDAVLADQHGIDGASTGVRYGGKTDHNIVDEIFTTKLGRAATEVERAAFIDAYVPRLHVELTRNGVDVIPGVAAALTYLAPRTPALGIATGNIRLGADAKLLHAKLDHWFSFGGYACDAPVRADLVAVAIRRGRERGLAGEVIVVGDTVHDIAAARANGATVVAVTTGSDSAEMLRDADAVFASLDELPAWHEARFGY